MAGIDKYPLKVTKSMGAKRISRRSKVKPFIKAVNYSHLMPTRYALDLEALKGAVTVETFKEVSPRVTTSRITVRLPLTISLYALSLILQPSQREDAKKNIKKVFEDRYSSGKNKWFFTALRF